MKPFSWQAFTIGLHGVLEVWVWNYVDTLHQSWTSKATMAICNGIEYSPRLQSGHRNLDVLVRSCAEEQVVLRVTFLTEQVRC